MLAERLKTHYILKGFSQETGFRVFTFERVGVDECRATFTVKTDIALTLRYGIRLQELPLLCRGLLEQGDADETVRAFTFAEDDMCRHADEASARAALARVSKHRRPPPAASTPGWRLPPR
jgi:hypothetical protein